MALSSNSDFMCFQKTPCGLYLGQCLVTFSLSVVLGYHVYRSIWTPVLGELLYTEQELGNPEDRYAVSVLKSSTIVGHILRGIVFTKRHLKIILLTFGARIIWKEKIP